MFNIGSLLGTLGGGLKATLTDPTTLLMGGKVLLGHNKGSKKNSKAKKIADEQKAKEKEFYEFNKAMLQESYDTSFQSYMGKYVEDRMNITDEYANAQSNLNMIATQNGVNLADSSFNDDIKNKLDREFNNELQNSYANVTNKLVQLITDKSIKDIYLDNNLQNTLNSIDMTLMGVQQQNRDNLYNDLTNLGLQAFDKFRGVSAKNKLSDLDTNSVSKYIKYEGYNPLTDEELLNTDFNFRDFSL